MRAELLRSIAVVVLAALGGLPAGARAEGQTPATQPAPRLPLKLFAQLERTRSAEISPDGSHFVAISNRDGRYCVTIHPLPVHAGKIILYPPYDPKFEYLWAHWAGDSHVLISEIAAFERGWQGMYSWSAGNETRLLSAAVDGSSIINAIRPIREAQTGSAVARETANVTAPVQDQVIDWMAGDPDHVLVSIADRPTEAGGASVRRVDVRTGDYTYVKSAIEGIQEWITDRAGEVRIGLGYSYKGSVNRWLTYRNPASGRWQEITDSPLATRNYSFVGFDADARYLLVLGPGADGRRALLRWDMVEGHSAGTVYSDPKQEAEGVVYAPDRSGAVIGLLLQNEDDVYLDDAWKHRMALLHEALPGMRLGITSVTRDGKQFIVEATSSTEPGVFYLFDSEKRQLTAIAYARSGLEPEEMAPVRWIEYRARDGLDIHGLLTVPRGREAKNLPVVLLPHGGPLAHDTGQFDWIAQFLANRGYAVLQPNFRGSTGYGIAFERAGDRQWGRAMQDDLSDGVQWLIQQGIADPTRIAIVGGSYGGYAALMGAAKTPELFRCAVSINGVSDLVALLVSDNGYFKDEEVAHLIGDPSADRGMLEAVSPIQQVDKMKVPVLLLHAKDDLRVDFSQSERMYGALRRAGKPVEFVAIGTGHHWLLNEAARTQVLTALEAFLEKNLRAQGS